MTTTTKGENSFVLFQEWDDKQETPGEMAILVEGFSDVISLQQGDNTINLNYHHKNELIKLLKQINP